MPTDTTQTTNRLAVVAFVAVVALGPLSAPAAVPMAIIARRRCVGSGERGSGLAQAAVFIGSAYLVLTTTVIGLRLLIGS